MSKKIHITVGIPAYNEARNISNLIYNIQAQKAECFILDSIIVSSDGSDDQTVSRASAFEHVIVIDDGLRKGKTMRMNEMFLVSQSEIIVIVDADIQLDSTALEHLVKPFQDDSGVMLVSGNLSPSKSNTIAGEISYVSYYLWDTAIKLISNSDMYHCGGALRAFRKPFYKDLFFPPITADDVYPYFVCVQRGYKFLYISAILGSYKLPSTMGDFRRQQKRFLESETVQEGSFGTPLVKELYTIVPMIKLRALLKTLIHSPLFTIAYLVVWFPIKLSSMLFKPKITGAWDSVVSTK